MRFRASIWPLGASPAQQERVGYRPALDGLRGIAVLLVILTHAGVPHLEGAGSVGVTLFFVMSGFLITRLLSREQERTGRISVSRFYARRARRLLPALSLLLIAVAAYLLSFHQSLLPVVLALGYSTNIANAMGHSQGNLDHTWTLSLEEQFYVLWPLVLPLVARRRHPALVLVVAAAASAALRSGLWLSGVPMFRVYNGPDTRADAILVGCALAFTGTSVCIRWWRGAVIVSVVVLATACMSPWSTLMWLLIPLPFASATLVILAERHPPRILCWRPLVATGKISYGLYLWNLPIAQSSLHAWDVPLWARAVTLLAANYSIAALSWFIIERPFARKSHGRRGAAVRSPLMVARTPPPKNLSVTD